MAHISKDIDFEIRLFADDCVCYREIKDATDTLKLQKGIDQMGCQARKCGMRFKLVDCNIMQISRNRIKTIHSVEQIRRVFNDISRIIFVSSP